MKRALRIAGLTLVLLFGLWTVAPAQVLNAITPALLQARLWTFSQGIAVSSGQKIYLEGSGGDTYLLRDADTNCVQQWKDGSLTWQLCGNRVIPPDCGSDLSSYALGSYCKDTSTGWIYMRTGGGFIKVTGVQR